MIWFIYFAFTVMGNLAWADPHCDRDDFIHRRVAALMDFNKVEPWSANNDPTVRSMNSDDPCWAPERFGWSKQDLALVASLRLNDSLLQQLQSIGRMATARDPSQAVAALKTAHPELNWSSKPLQKWIESTQLQWTMITQLNQPNACRFKRIDVGPVREQRNPWCVGMVAADMLGNASGHFLSVSDLALQMNLEINEFGVLPELQVAQPLFHGSLGAAIKPALDTGMKGLCLENNFKSGIVASGRHSSEILKNFFEQASTGTISDLLLREMKMVFPGVANTDLFTVPYTPMAVVSIADESCAPRIRTTGFEAIEKWGGDFEDEREQVNTIDTVLNSGLIVGVGLTSDSIDSGQPISPQEGHAVSIVGKRFGSESKKCEYLVRSSWGTSWANGGYKWVPRDHLLSGVEKIAYLRPLK